MALTGTLDVSVSSDEVEFTFEVTNDGSEPVDLTFPNACTADVAVIDGNDEVWRWSNDRMFAQMIQQVSLGPGESEVEVRVWDAPEPGDYEAVATLTAQNADVEARTSFSV